MRAISMERVESTRNDILNIIKSPCLTHEQKLTNLASKADSLLEVLDLPAGIEELLEPVEGKQCICDLFEGNAPLRPRYIAPKYDQFMKKGSKFLQLEAPKDFFEALNHLLILYKHVPSVTNYPVYLGALDELLEPFIHEIDDETAKKFMKFFMIHIDRTIPDSFSHVNLGPKETRVGRLLLEVEEELEQAVPNITFRYEEGVTPDDYAKRAIQTSLRSAKPSFANHKMFSKEFQGEYIIASCYNGLPYGGGSYTLCRLILGNIAKRAKSKKDFMEDVLPYVLDMQARFMDARVKFIVEESGFFENHFLAKEGLIEREQFTAMFGLVGLAEAVNTICELEGMDKRFGKDKEADEIGVEIMELIHKFNQNHIAPYCEATNHHYLLHAQVGIAEDKGVSPGTRIPIGEEPENVVDHLLQCNLFHKYFPSGTGDIFPIESTANKNLDYILDIIKGAFSKEIRYLSFHNKESDVIRVTGYLVKRSEIEKYKKGERVLQSTTHLGTGATINGRILERKVR
ncbi:MAG: YjjI family glycine radical enzyme [Lachnospiraceae bacterium]